MMYSEERPRQTDEAAHFDQEEVQPTFPEVAYRRVESTRMHIQSIIRLPPGHRVVCAVGPITREGGF